MSSAAFISAQHLGKLNAAAYNFYDVLYRLTHLVVSLVYPFIALALINSKPVSTIFQYLEQRENAQESERSAS
jgi:hypothetical protein